jgi:hypothetical protein
MMRKYVLSLLVVSTLFAFCGNAKAQSGVDIRYYVVQSSGLFEVIDNSKPAALFNKRLTNEYVAGKRVVGFTDRASRKENIIVQVRGTGVAESGGVEINGRKRIEAKNLSLPFVFATPVSADANDDNITSFITQKGKTTRRRLPVGTR